MNHVINNNINNINNINNNLSSTSIDFNQQPSLQTMKNNHQIEHDQDVIDDDNDDIENNNNSNNINNNNGLIEDEVAMYSSGVKKKKNKSNDYLSTSSSTVGTMMIDSKVKIALSLYKVQQNIYLLDFQRVEVCFIYLFIFIT
jgi:hypothetical protein